MPFEMKPLLLHHIGYPARPLTLPPRKKIKIKPDLHVYVHVAISDDDDGKKKTQNNVNIILFNIR